MILEKVDFRSIFDEIFSTFSEKKEDYDPIRKLVVELSDANFHCYKANMEILKQRKLEESIGRNKDISDAEYVARTVGEKRVGCKSMINLHFAKKYNQLQTVNNSFEDDIVYSIGEMLDRILIEHIKQQDFGLTKDNEKILKSKKWQKRVLKYLGDKLYSVKERGYYESLEETRTYRI